MIVKTRGANAHMRSNGNGLAAFGIQDLGFGSVQPAVSLTPRTGRGIPSVTQAVRIAATAVANLALGVYTGQGLEKRQVTSGWLADLFTGTPNPDQTLYGFKEAIEESLSYRGNAFVWLNRDPVSGAVVEWYALHPDQVVAIQTAGARRYLVFVTVEFVDPVGRGPGTYEVGSSTLLHIRGHGEGGKWLAPSPVSQHRLSMGRALAKIGHENSVYGNGASLRGVINFPDGVSPTQLTAIKETWQATYEGVGNGGKTGIIGGGGVFTPIGLTMEDAQFVEGQQFDVEEIARIFNVPASLMGGGGTSGGRAQAPLTPEHETQRWLSYGLGGRLMRIESALSSSPVLFNGKSDPYPWFKTDELVRGDSAANAAIILGKVQSGQLLIDEARALDGRKPLPDGAGQIPQITPVGGAPNATPPPIDGAP